MKNPDWVSYIIDKDKVKKYLSRDNVDFKEDNEILPAFRARLKSYKGSGYHRGHMMPNAMADYSIKTQRESFLLSNIVPQLPNHNRTIWKKLEESVRDLSKKVDVLNVITGVIYNKNHRTIGNGVAVPSYFYKVILAPKTVETFAFLIPHKEFKDGSSFRKFQVTVDEVEEKTGIDFFSNIRKDIQEKIENKKYKW
jgi:endonuclease G